MPAEIASAFVVLDGPEQHWTAAFGPCRVEADTWNGWARPVFTPDTLPEIAEFAMREYASSDGNGVILCQDRDGRWCEVQPAEWEHDARGPIDPAGWAWSYLPVMPDGGVMIDGWCWTVLACNECGEVHSDDTECPDTED